MSYIFKTTLLLTFFFGIDKIIALIRQTIIIKQFGFSSEIDAFNAANNLPDLLFSLISGGALALAFIPILTKYIETKSHREAWRLFSVVANLVFFATAVLSIIVAIFAPQVVSSQFGIAPGFTVIQQDLVVNLMRLNLIATLIFSISGLTMAALQSSKHFLLPALAPILYNVGQIFGAIFLVPLFGVYGLEYGVILGAVLHLSIQIPGMIYYKFTWTPSFNIKDSGVQRVFRLLGPRILTVLCIQIMFLTRDNLASRLQEGSVTALTYGYFIMQVPETLIGTAIATALLPTLSSLIAAGKKTEFTKLLNSTIAVIFAITFVSTLLLSVSLEHLILPIFGFHEQNAQLLIWVSRVYLLGLLSQCLLEVVIRAFYAKLDAKIPFLITFLRTLLFMFLALVLLQPLGAVGLALADSVAITLEVGILFWLLRKSLPNLLTIHGTIFRTITGSAISLVTMYLLLNFTPFPQLPRLLFALFIGGLICLFFIWKELKLLLKL